MARSREFEFPWDLWYGADAELIDEAVLAEEISNVALAWQAVHDRKRSAGKSGRGLRQQPRDACDSK